MNYRFENFGGIVAGEEPPFLAFVDRDFMRGLGLGESTLWRDVGDSIGVLSAPTEVHLAVTNSCPVGCPHCYMGAGEADPGELDTPSLKRALEGLAKMGVFHVALGGGEALARPDLFEGADHAREVGLVPNLTVSGALMTPGTARRMTVFGQVNVSVDGVGEAHGAFRRRGMFEAADAALEMLVRAGVPTGINCVVGRRNFEQIPGLFDYAKRRGANEIEFLRLKPAGRGGRGYLDERTTIEQNVRLTPMLAELSGNCGIPAKIDCSFIPMLCHHEPPREALLASATYGCEAGNVLLGVRSDGLVSGCSFLKGDGLSVFELRASWRTDADLQALRSWPQRAPEPCRLCDYLDICRGGCRAVAAFLTGDPDAPDPDCPRVVEFGGRGGRR